MAPWDGLETAQQLRRRLVICPPIHFWASQVHRLGPAQAVTTHLAALVEASLDPVH